MSVRASDTCGVSDLADTKARYEHALAEVTKMKRTLAERARHVAELEERLMRQVSEGASRGVARRRPAGPEPTESELARAVSAAEAEKALAQAEREQLDERERNIRKVERELAGLRVQLEKEWRRITGENAPQPTEASPSAPAAAPPQQPRPAGAPATAARRRPTKKL